MKNYAPLMHECIAPNNNHTSGIVLPQVKLEIDTARAAMLALEHSRDQLTDATIGLALFAISQQLKTVSETLGGLLCAEGDHHGK